MLIDLHAYPQRGGSSTIPDVIKQAKASGLDGVCFVDRQIAKGVARSVLDGDFGDYPVFVGVEISTRSGDVIAIVPELGEFYLNEEWRQVDSLQARPPLSDVQALVEEQGGVILVAHPYDRDRTSPMRDKIFMMKDIAGVEVATNGASGSSNQLSLESVPHAPHPSFAGSADRNGGVGRWATLFADAPSDQRSLVEALKGGNFWAVELGRGGGSGGSERRSSGRSSSRQSSSSGRRRN